MMPIPLAGLVEAEKFSGPHMPSYFTSVKAWATASRSCGFFTFFSASMTISKSEYVEPIDWTHWPLVTVWYFAAKSYADSPVSDDLYGAFGENQQSVATLLDS